MKTDEWKMILFKARGLSVFVSPRPVWPTFTANYGSIQPAGFAQNRPRVHNARATPCRFGVTVARRPRTA